MLSGIGMSGRILHYNLLDLSFEHTKEWQQYAASSDLWGALQIFQQSNNRSKLFLSFLPKGIFPQGMNTSLRKPLLSEMLNAS